MKLIVGLGNPGEKYINTRHNVGFLFVDFLAKKYEGSFKHDKYMLSEMAQIKMNDEEILLAKPQTFMNRSGEAVTKLAIRYSLSPSDMLIAHDDLDIQLGEFKINLAKGPKLHNGIASIEELYKTNEFWRIRIGIDNRNGAPIQGETYVLQNFDSEEMPVLPDTFKKILDHPSFPL